MSVRRILLRIRCDNGDALRVKTRPAGEYRRDGGVGVQLEFLKTLNASLFFEDEFQKRNRFNYRQIKNYKTHILFCMLIYW